MTHHISTDIAAALIASASFGSAALAEGDYFEGVSKAAITDSVAVDHVNTGSIGQKAETAPTANGQAEINSGEYFTGTSHTN